MRSPLIAALYLSVSIVRADFVNFETPQVHPIDISPDGSTLAVCNTADNRVEFFDLQSGTPTPIGSVPVGIDPTSVRFRTDGELWAVNQISDSISVIDVSARIVSKTLQTKDEPADVVFAGSPQRAYITCSAVDAVQIFDPSGGLTPTGEIAIEGEDPRALAVSPDGMTVYAAVFESGNNSTILAGGGDGDVINFPPNAVSHPSGPYGGTNPPPNDGASFSPAQRAGNPPPPPVGLIVRKDGGGVWRDDNGADWSALVTGNLAPQSGRITGWDLIDNDLALIDTTDNSASYITGLMNICMGVGVNPSSGDIFVVGTEATNEIRFEPNVNGTFARVNMARVEADHSSAAIGDLNPHLTYSSPTTTVPQREQSIGDPRSIAWRADGSVGYVAGMGSNNIIPVLPSGARSGSPIEVGEGPTGAVVDDARGQLYVLNRFEATISVVDTNANTETARIALFDPTPTAIKTGRPHFYDTQRTSGLGHVSCATCHVDARTDRLAWDLGDPGEHMIAVGGPRHNLGGGLPGLNTNFTNFHPMKGPMTTQTMQDIIGKEPHHWRGDRDGIEDFNGAFVSLLGDDTGLTTAEMQEFEDYLATITIPPNPFRDLDNDLPTNVPLTGQVTGARFGTAGQPMPAGNALRAFADIYRPLSRGIDRGAFACITCHTVPTGMGTDYRFNFQTGFLPLAPGPNGERHHALVSVDGSSQRAFKIPQTRTMYDKLGFDMTSTKSRSGFGILHDGSVDGLSRFLSEEAFEPNNNQEVADMVALMMAFSGSDFPGTPEGIEPPGVSLIPGTMMIDPQTESLDAHAAVGQQETVTNSTTTSRLEQFIDLADAGEIDLVAHSTVSGVPRSWRSIGGDQFATDQAGLTESKATVLSRASTSAPITFTCVPAGCGERLGGDRDRDGILDFDEFRDFSPAITGHQNPFQSNALDSTGDNGSTVPDGIPDGQNDFDGDGIDNATELANSTNPAGNLAVEVPFNETIAATDTTLTLSWDAAPLGEYQMQFSDSLDSWSDAPDSHFVAPATTTRLTWDDIPASRRFYRIVRLR